MLPFEFGFIFLYVAAFGFSDYFVKIMKFKDFYYILYYILIGIIGFYILYISKYFEKLKI